LLGSQGAVAQAQTTTFRLSSGPFGLPAAGRAVDWTVTNSSGEAHTIRVTVYRHSTGAPREVVPPGTLTVTLGPFTSTHNANGIGTVFPRGFTYEVVVQTDSRSILPMVTVWEDGGGTVIPGTLIPSGSWVRLP
jgi:hypothetical protein